MKSVALEIEVCGPLAVRVHGKPLPRLRSYKSLLVLALLALRHGREVQREWLAETLWPDSIFLKAQYNLRRSLSELRTALASESGVLLSPSIRTLQLDMSRCRVDIADLETALQRGDGDCALSTYRGALLEGYSEEWILPERRIREESFLALLETLAAQSPPSQAEQYLRRAHAIQPLRESIYPALMPILASTGNYAELTQLYRELRIRLRDEFNTQPDLAIRSLYERLISERLPPSLTQEVPAIPPPRATYSPPGGPVPLDSTVYVTRLVDRLFQESVERGDSIALLKGPRQTGKSSLLARGVRAAHQAGHTVVVQDITQLDANTLSDPTLFYPALCKTLAYTFEGMEPLSAQLTPSEALERWLRRALQTHPTQRLIWALDGLDSVFSQPWRDDFFALLRSWHNERAFDPDGPWRRLTLALTYSTEAHLFITDPNQSPFNVGTRLFLADFTTEETDRLQRQHGIPLKTPQELERFRSLVGGHPYLTLQGLYALTSLNYTLESLEKTPPSSFSSPFREHLTLLLTLLETPETRAGVTQVLQQKLPLERGLFFRLRSAGILVGETPESATLRCGLYASCFRGALT
jgi:DNA-binding SARP family transcriptional activator